MKDRSSSHSNGFGKSVSSSAASGGGGKEGKGGRKMSSLSSFQATLNFSAIPKTAASSRPSPCASTSSTGRSFARTASSDARLMPPPSVPVHRDASSSSQASSSKQPIISGRSAGSAASVKGKERELADEDDFEVLGSSNPSLSSGMWADIYAPKSIADLAPGKARIASIKDWLHLALYGHPPDAQPLGPQAATACDKVRKYKRILLVTGPPGIAKSTTVRVVAREMGVELVEWGDGVEEYNRESLITKISTFLSRNEYAPLALSSSSQARSARPRVLLMTSLPNLSHGSTKDAFHSALGAFARAYTSSSAPLVIVYSEVGNHGAAEESWRDRDRGGREGALEVLGKEVMEGPWSAEVSFLPIAPTFMLKALRRVLESARQTNDFDPPAASALQLIALTSNGDLRSAINSIQLLCTHGQAEKRNANIDAGTVGQKRKAAKGGSGSSKVAVVGKDARGWVKSKLDVPKDVRAVLDALTRKEQNLNLFHALGKVLYNKRLGDPGQAEEDQEVVSYITKLPPQDELPDHLRDFERRRSLVVMEDFVGNIPLDASSFALWLHQNAPSNCVEIEEAAVLLDELGAADIMKTDDDIWQSSTQAIGYALHISVRGVQMGLPSPVPRRGAKVVKPQFFKSYKDQRKNGDLIDIASAYVTKKAVASSCALSAHDLDAAANAQDQCLGVWGGMASQGVLAAEILPMMIKMQGLTSLPLLPATVAPLQLPPWKLVNVEEGAEELSATQVLTDDMDLDMSGTLDELPDHASHGWDMGEDEVEEERGWLEDDDIEDFD